MSLSQRLPTHAFECTVCCSSRLTDLKRMRNLGELQGAESIWDHTRREDAKAAAHVLCVLSIAACLISAAVGACSGEPEYTQWGTHSVHSARVLESGGQVRWRCDAMRCGRLPFGDEYADLFGGGSACGMWHEVGGRWQVARGNCIIAKLGRG